MFWTKLFVLLLALGVVWLCWRLVKNSPGSFTWANFSKSTYTLGILALILIGLVAAMVMFLGHN
jgi:hypothetical protein